MISNTFRKLQILKLACISTVATIAATLLPSFVKNVQLTQQTQSSLALEKHRVELATETANLYREKGVANFDSMVALDYAYQPGKPPEMDWERSFDPTKRTLLYDKDRICVGSVYAGKFYFIDQYPETCK